MSKGRRITENEDYFTTYNHGIMVNSDYIQVSNTMYTINNDTTTIISIKF